MHLDLARLKSGLLLVGVVVFAILGQHYLFYRREYLWDGLIFIGIALLCFAGLNRSLTISRPAAPRALGRFQGRLGGRAVVAGLAVVLNFIAARSANANSPPNDYTISVVLWLTSLVLFFVAFVPYPNRWRDPRQTLRLSLRASRLSRYELVLILGLLLVGLLLRAWNLEHIPVNLSGDEGTQGVWARDVLEGRLRNPFATGWFTVPTMSYFALAGSLRLFGDSVAGLRAMSALIGSATLIFVYLLARKSLGRRVALFGLFALAVNHFHIHFSRLSMNNVADPFFAALTLWLLTEGLQRVSGAGREPSRLTPWFLATGLSMGISWYGYWGSRLILVIVAVYLGTWVLQDRGFLRRHARDLILMALATLMAVSPQLLYFTRFPQHFSARFNQVSFFRWLENELARPDHASTLSLLWRQVWRSLSGFNHTLDPTFWYRSEIPLLDFVSGILFILGLVVAVRRWRRPGVRLVLIWFGLALTFGWILTENPPSSMRMVINAPAVALLVALGLDRLLALAHRIIGGWRAQWTQIGLSLLAIAAVLNVHYYFFVYTPTRVYGNPTAEIGTVLARHLTKRVSLLAASGDLEPGQGERPMVYFYGPPSMYYDFGTLRFMAHDISGVSVPPPNEQPDYETQVLGPTFFIFLARRMDELAQVQSRHRGGRSQEFYSDADGRLMYVVYEVLP